MSSPTVDHWVVIEQTLSFLKAPLRRRILYRKIKDIQGLNWAGSREDRRLTYGYCVFVGRHLVSWRSKKQNVVSCLSAELEYKAMTLSVCEIVWIQQLLFEIGFSITLLAKLWCDNQVGLHIASNLIFHEQTKHIEVDYHFIRGKIQEGFVST